MRWPAFIIVGIVTIAWALWYTGTPSGQPAVQLAVRFPGFRDIVSPTPTPTPAPPPLPPSALIPNEYHIFQTFNNCGPAALSMALSYWGISKSQSELGAQMRPYANPQGNNDDKSVTLAELARKVPEYGLTGFHRPGGSAERIKQFVAAGIPVITRTRLKAEDDIGHFRIVKGYDDSEGVFIQDDSLQGKNLRYAYGTFSTLWQTFGYEYLVIVPQDKLDAARQILGGDLDESSAWRAAANAARALRQADPSDIYAGLNLSVALYHTGDYTRSVQEFENVESKLPRRTLWYQTEPILSYSQLGLYDRVFRITDAILRDQNRAYSELYLIRGNIYKKQGNTAAAREEFAKAVLYNTSLTEARDALQSVSP